MFSSKILIICLTLVCSSQTHKSVKKRAITFPQGAIMGVLIAIATPLDLPNFDVFLSYNFEANYGVPTNASDYTQGPAWYRVQRSTDAMKSMYTRRNLYSWMENLLDFYDQARGKGSVCLQRAICEHASYSFAKHNGLFGDLAHILLSPSSSTFESGLEPYLAAESQGKQSDCTFYRKHCVMNVLDLVSKFG